MRISEAEYNRFFDNVESRQTIIPSTGETCEMPLRGIKGVQMISFHTADRAKVLDMLPVPDLVPLKLPFGKTLVGFIGIEYQERNIDNYNEVIVVVPVNIGKNAKAPSALSLLKDDIGGTTLYIHHLAVNTEMSKIVGNEILGYNKFIADINFFDMEDQRVCTMKVDGEDVLYFTVGSNKNRVGEPERNTLRVCSYKNNQLTKLTYSSQAKYPGKYPRRGQVAFGDHPMGKALSELKISRKPLITKYTDKFQLISDDKNLEYIDV